MAITNYHTVNGEILGETTAGVRTSYLTDGLDNVTATQNAAGTTLATWRYKPYGSLLAKTGGGTDPRFLWTGASGSRAAALEYAGQYNRARHLSPVLASWISSDLLWPAEAPYSYVECNPVSSTDPSGLLAANHTTKIFLRQPGCAGFISEWDIWDKTGSPGPLYLKQAITATSTCYDCDTKAKCTEPQIRVSTLEVFKFTKEKQTGVLFVGDEWTAVLGRRPGGKSWACTRGTIEIKATYDIFKSMKWAPPTPPWTPLIRNVAGKRVTVGYQISPYKGTWKGKYERSVVYQWDCCLDPIWYKFVATGSAMPTHVQEEPTPKPTRARTCPARGGIGHEG